MVWTEDSYSCGQLMVDFLCAILFRVYAIDVVCSVACDHSVAFGLLFLFATGYSSVRSPSLWSTSA